MKKYKLLIIDDHSLVGEAWKAILSNEKDLEVVAVTHGVDNTIELLRQDHIDLVLLDVNMQPISGFEMAGLIKKISPTTFILTVSMYDQPAIVKKMIKAGANGYITKNAKKAEMLQAISSVLNGKKFISADVQTKFTDELLEEDNSGTAQRNLNKLTDKELEILKHVKEGLTSKEIAEHLTISFKTVQVHRHNILKKLNLKNTASLLNLVSNAAVLS